MTFYEFWTEQTVLEIKKEFERVGLKDYRDFPENVGEFCKKFNLIDDFSKKDKLNHYFTIKRSGGAEVYINISFDNLAFPKCPIRLECEFYVSGTSSQKRKSCSVNLCKYGGNHVKIFSEVCDFFDSRPDYNNPEIAVNIDEFSNLVDKEVNKYGEEYYAFKKDKTLKDVANELNTYALDIKPTIEEYMKAVKTKEYKKLWDTANPTKRLTIGDAIFNGYYISLLHFYHRVRKLSLSNSFEDFIKLVSVLDAQLMKDDKNVDEIFNRKITDDILKEVWEKIMTLFDENFNFGSDLENWKKVYNAANREYKRLLTVFKDSVSEEFGINPKYLDPENLDWNDSKIPEDAYKK